MCPDETAPKTGVTAHSVRAGNVVTVHIVGSVPNPLVLLLPNIDYEFEFSIDFEDQNNPRFLLTGAHDGFPNYEVYVNERQVYGYVHGDQWPISLFPPMEWIVGPVLGALRP